MKQRILFLLLLWFGMGQMMAQEGAYPDSICIDGQQFHVQGIAFDKVRKCMYFSFTNRLVKTDLQGNVLASVDGIQGHLGAITLHPETGKVYASLECKDDEIGQGIAGKMNFEQKSQSMFYVAVFDTERMNRKGIDSEGNPVMKTVYIAEATEDYRAKVVHQGKEVEHRYGCSGIDGVTFAPKMGSRKGEANRLYVGYGIYGDTLRTDNDHQVLLCYDVRKWERYAQLVDWKRPHTKGPRKPEAKYFAFTGNTTYGIQNMTYDPTTRQCFLAVYRGKKSRFPNYDLFAIDTTRPVKKQQLDAPKGWYFRWGSTGICALGDGLFYISHNRSGKTKGQGCCARLYRWTGQDEAPFAVSTVLK